MLKKFLDIKRDNLQTMVKVRHQLEEVAERESYRLQMLQQHVDSLPDARESRCSLSLQNSSNIKTVLAEMINQQSEVLERANEEALRQRNACINQAKFNRGIELVEQKKEVDRLRLQEKKEQKQMDELSAQFAMKARP